MQKGIDKENASSYKSEFWGICCESGKRYSQLVRKKFHVSMAALDPTVVNTSPCVSLLVERGGCQYLLCNLKPDSILQVSLNLFFDKGERITFFLKGHGTVHLSGYHIYNDLSTPEKPNKVVSPNKEKVDSKLTANESTDEEDEESEENIKIMKDSQKIKLGTPSKKGNTFDTPSKKNLSSPSKKAQTPKATPKKKESSDDEEESSEEEDDDDDDDDEDDDDNEEMDKAYEKIDSYLKKIGTSGKRQRSAEEESSDEEESSEEDSFEASNKTKSAQSKEIKEFKDAMNKKRMKMDAPTPSQGNKKKSNQNASETIAEVIDLEDSDSKTPQKFVKLGGLNTSIGRTPMPKKLSASQQIANSLGNSSGLKKKLQKKSPVDEIESSESSDSDEMDVSPSKTPVQNKSPQQLDTSAQSTDSKKKKRKKKKNTGANESQIANTPQDKGNETPKIFKSGKKLAGGIEYEDMKVGNGLEAKKGKVVHVYYVGRLQNNKLFDSRQPGAKPFSFKLGSGQVIKGWDIGLEGMKVGGKRRLKIPPHMGYSSQRMGDIPPNSTLNFVVELKAVS